MHAISRWLAAASSALLLAAVPGAAMAQSTTQAKPPAANPAEKPALKVTISGYHSASGTVAQNQELAKQRAFTVRDSLLAAGVAESRVVLAKPQQTQANPAGEDHDSRRVEVTLK